MFTSIEKLKASFSLQLLYLLVILCATHTIGCEEVRRFSLLKFLKLFFMHTILIHTVINDICIKSDRVGHNLPFVKISEEDLLETLLSESNNDVVVMARKLFAFTPKVLMMLKRDTIKFG